MCVCLSVHTCVLVGVSVYRTVDLSVNVCGHIFIPNGKQSANSPGGKNKLATVQTVP